MRRSPLPPRRAALRTRRRVGSAQNNLTRAMVEHKEAMEAVARAQVRLEVFKRDGRCLLAFVAGESCRGPLTPHHLRKASQGGTYTAENLVALCAGHNDWVEDYPRRAHDLGLVIRAGETRLDAERARRAAGIG